MGFAPTGKRRLCTAHTQPGHSSTDSFWRNADLSRGYHSALIARNIPAYCPSTEKASSTLPGAVP
ncbi:hypothetical protein V1286_007757 [Bradyrhizobium algeriense]|uniref:Uncharacterized protein n=1 Tax=Bradyrhizobium algeriense TaxID=634784 RepID=A0ABU8BQM9_9BRAD